MIVICFIFAYVNMVYSHNFIVHAKSTAKVHKKSHTASLWLHNFP